MHVTVEAYSGYKANERPQRFQLAGRSYDVVQILDRWHGPDSLYFKIRAGDGNDYILRYDSDRDEWSLGAFRQADSAVSPGGVAADSLRGNQ